MTCTMITRINVVLNVEPEDPGVASGSVIAVFLMRVEARSFKRAARRRKPEGPEAVG
jgi:hypothetical protein